ncbi:uncharacterized protein LOC124368354 [Homalodisca vitripennis]|uniref:uncharacterized protein LOC124368354 n=1 Tax=Homalodisca vitripennis TaxID=197043 RepID=UPI001EEA73EF|nr:uncharacterized protein LOC124368354 [Homalodisca vitripennis]
MIYSLGRKPFRFNQIISEQDMLISPRNSLSCSRCEACYWCLKDVALRVPEAVRAGDSLTLSCDFILEQEHLYSVKFYQGDTEFYRYVPEESPPTRVFPIEGVNVDISRSNSSSVTLSNVHRDMTGYYKCEVSADAPLFHTGIKTSFVTVTEEPWALPAVTTEKFKYSLGEKIRANCTSQGGYPPANLTWYINGQQVKHSPLVKVLYETMRGTRPDDSDTAVLRLEVDSSPKVFLEGRLRLRCLATQFTLYRRSTELDIVEDTPQLAPVLGPTAPHQDSNSGTRTSDLMCSFVFLVVLMTTWIASSDPTLLR